MENHKIKIVGGMSMPGSITLQSTKHSAIAMCVPEGFKITVRNQPPLGGFLHEHRLLPIPQTIRFVLFLLSNLSSKALALIVTVTVGLFLFGSHLPGPEPSPKVALITDVLLAVWFIFYLYRIRPWHAAEHMAIGAYDSGEGSSSWKAIAGASRVDPRCGGRFVLPLIIVTHIAHLSLIASGIELGQAAFWSNVISWEIILWVDVLIGWYNVPVFREASALLQRYLTTCDPEPRHLKTAKVALDALIMADFIRLDQPREIFLTDTDQKVML